MYHNKYPNILAHINLKAIRNNFLILKKKSLHSKIGAVVKADAYGIGIKYVVPELEKIGCRDFFVSSINEGLEVKLLIKEQNSKIFLLHGICKNSLQDILENKQLIPVVNSLEQLDFLINAAQKYNIKISTVLNFNLYMNRLGLSEFDLIHNNNNLNKKIFKYLNILYLMGHLSASEKINAMSNIVELKKFHQICSYFDANIPKTLANSNALKLGPKYLFDLVRSGCAIYGISKFSDQDSVDKNLQEVVSIYSHIIQLSKIPKNQPVGYNSNFKTDKETIIAIVPIGYADGFIRSFSYKNFLYIEGFQAPIIGTVSMDLTIIDVTSIPKHLLFLGQKVEIIGKNQTIYHLAKIADTISYEVLTVLMLSRRVKRLITDDHIIPHD